MWSDKKDYDVEKRENVRWEQIIPMKFALINGEREVVLKEMQHASIHNISANGVSIEMGQLEQDLKDDLISGRIKLILEIQLPSLKEPIFALAKVSWLSKLWKEGETAEGKYLMGLRFVDITVSSRDIIIDYILKSYVGCFKKEGR